MATASTGDTMSPQLLRVARRGLGSMSRSGDPLREPSRRKSRMVEISMSGSGEGLGWATDRGYSTNISSLRQGLGAILVVASGQAFQQGSGEPGRQPAKPPCRCRHGVPAVRLWAPSDHPGIPSPAGSPSDGRADGSLCADTAGRPTPQPPGATLRPPPPGLKGPASGSPRYEHPDPPPSQWPFDPRRRSHNKNIPASIPQIRITSLASAFFLHSSVNASALLNSTLQCTSSPSRGEVNQLIHSRHVAIVHIFLVLYLDDH